MTLNDEDLKRIFRSYVGKRDSGTRQGCPSFSELSRFFDPETRRRDKLNIIDHVTDCSACAEEFEFLRGLHNYQSQIAQNASNLRSDQRTCAIPPQIERGKRSLWRYAPIAAGALLLMISLSMLTKWDRPGETRTASSSVALLRPGQNQTVLITMTFEWEPVEWADAYILEVFDEALLPVWKSQEVTAILFKPPEELRSRLRPDSHYFWMVTALRNGNKLAESELRRFTMGRKAP